MADSSPKESRWTKNFAQMSENWRKRNLFAKFNRSPKFSTEMSTKIQKFWRNFFVKKNNLMGPEFLIVEEISYRTLLTCEFQLQLTGPQTYWSDAEPLSSNSSRLDGFKKLQETGSIPAHPSLSPGRGKAQMLRSSFSAVSPDELCCQVEFYTALKIFCKFQSHSYFQSLLPASCFFLLQTRSCLLMAGMKEWWMLRQLGYQP